MKQLILSRTPIHLMTNLAGLFASCALISACGGGGGGESPERASQGITPNTTVVATAASEAASSASELASAPTASIAAASGADSVIADAASAAAKASGVATGSVTTPLSITQAVPAMNPPETTPLAAPVTMAQATAPAAQTNTAAAAPAPAPAPSATSATTATTQAAATALQPSYNIGVYYFPGWSNNMRGSVFTYPWAHIKPYTAREPLLGWYSDADPLVLRKQADMMRAGGIGFVAFDSYWDDKGPYMDHALKAYGAIWRSGDPQFTMLWANHFVWKGGRTNFNQMIDKWIADYLSKPGYLRIDGKPVLFVFSVEEFQRTAQTIGITVAQLGAATQERARAAGLPGIYLVGGAPALAHWVKGVAVEAGFSALTAYNYHSGYSGDALTVSASPKNFTDLAANYQQNWQWIAKHSPLPYIVPMTAGWDKSPWLDLSKGQTTYSAIAEPAQFETHLRAGKSLMDSNPSKTQRIGIICCWNEFGEGSYIEPTKQKGSQVLDRVKTVFGIK